MLLEAVLESHKGTSITVFVLEESPETLKHLESPPAIVQRCKLWRSPQPRKTHVVDLRGWSNEILE